MLRRKHAVHMRAAAFRYSFSVKFLGVDLPAVVVVVAVAAGAHEVADGVFDAAKHGA